MFSEFQETANVKLRMVISSLFMTVLHFMTGSINAYFEVQFLLQKLADGSERATRACVS